MLGITRSIGDVIAEIKMAKMAFGGSFMLVEGPSDAQFWKEYIDKETCQTIRCDNKHVSISVLTEVLEKSIAEAVAVVDEDYDFFLGIAHQVPGLMVTDTHDIETLLLSSKAFNKVLSEYGNESMVS